VNQFILLPLMKLMHEMALFFSHREIQMCVDENVKMVRP